MCTIRSLEVEDVFHTESKLCTLSIESQIAVAIAWSAQVPHYRWLYANGACLSATQVEIDSEACLRAQIVICFVGLLRSEAM